MLNKICNMNVYLESKEKKHCVPYSFTKQISSFDLDWVNFSQDFPSCAYSMEQLKKKILSNKYKTKFYQRAWYLQFQNDAAVPYINQGDFLRSLTLKGP